MLKSGSTTVLETVTDFIPLLHENPALRADEYSSPESFAYDYLRYNLSRKVHKATGGLPPEERRRRAYENFVKTESSMAEVNRKLENQSRPGVTAASSQILWRAQELLHQLLSTAPSLLTLINTAEITNGASALLPRTKSHKYDKLSAPCVTATLDCAKYFGRGVRHIFGTHKQIQLVPGNTQETVPKTAEIDRLIAKEPILNMAVQRSLAKVMIERLRNFRCTLRTGHVIRGYDLPSAADRHRNAMGYAVLKDLATVDLENASNSIARNLVRFLVPWQWYELLLATRSNETVTLEGEVRPLEMFSAMGNGFTFELETLVFYVLVLAVCEVEQTSTEDISVFGDDIIMPIVAVERLGSVFDELGMIINQQKSFTSGPFRESCGMHTFNGCDVSPFFMRQDGFDPRQEALALLNRHREWSCFDAYPLPELREALLLFLPNSERVPRIPLGYGDVALTGSSCEWLPHARTSNSSLEVRVSRHVRRSVASAAREIGAYIEYHLDDSLNIMSSITAQRCPGTAFDFNRLSSRKVNTRIRSTNGVKVKYRWTVLDPKLIGADSVTIC